MPWQLVKSLRLWGLWEKKKYCYIFLDNFFSLSSIVIVIYSYCFTIVLTWLVTTAAGVYTTLLSCLLLPPRASAGASRSPFRWKWAESSRCTGRTKMRDWAIGRSCSCLMIAITSHPLVIYPHEQPSARTGSRRLVVESPQGAHLQSHPSSTAEALFPLAEADSQVAQVGPRWLVKSMEGSEEGNKSDKSPWNKGNSNKFFKKLVFSLENWKLPGDFWFLPSF